MDTSRRKSNEELVNPVDKEKNVDRLSNLPESVICHILSFLPTVQSVKSSVLARSWRYLWTAVPVLDFDFSRLNLDFLLNKKGYDPCEVLDTYEISDLNGSGEVSARIFYARMGYYEVLSRVMILNCQRLNRFRLQCSVFDLTDFQLDTCITGAVARGVKNLVFGYDVEFDEDVIIDYGTKMPYSLFCCRTIVDLSLTHCLIYIPPSVKVSLSSLKKLRLVDIKYGDSRAFPELISGCPILEEIIIEHWIPEKLPAVNCPPTLVKADITFSFPLELWWPDVFLNSLSAVKSLKLWYRSADKGSRDECDLPSFSDDDSDDDRNLDRGDIDIDFTSLTCKFNNLVRLEIPVGYWGFLFKILENADFLKHLEVRVVEDVSDWSELPQVPTSLISHLETIEIVIMQRYPRDSFFPLVRYVLKNARILKKMNIFLGRFLEDEVSEYQAKISSLERGSTDCKVQYVI